MLAVDLRLVLVLVLVLWLLLLVMLLLILSWLLGRLLGGLLGGGLLVAVIGRRRGVILSLFSVLGKSLCLCGCGVRFFVFGRDAHFDFACTSMN
jgi:hypothetical protein